MRELEHRFSAELLVIGVHSGKYTAERETSRIREAALRLGAHHPIINDRQFRVWRGFAVRAWPTTVVIGPRGDVLATHPGEFTAARLEPFLRQVIDTFDAELDRAERTFPPDSSAVEPGALRYPGKLTVEGRRMAIADSGHDRVLIGALEPDGLRLRVERIVGGRAGFEDGSEPRFASPQGVLFDEDTLYVADAGNHAIRAIDLTRGTVRTVAGTGTQLRSARDLERGALASPWDLTAAGGALFVAMAGIHRIWRIDPRTGQAAPFSGSGREDLIDGPHVAAGLAQPMGIAADTHRLYFADAESSAIRWVELAVEGTVGTIVGTGLFDFGDRDGIADAVRLQHPQAVLLHPNGRLLIADSYNDALKWIEPRTRVAETWVRGLNEPGGLALGDGVVYVADTNAHRIAVVAERTGAVTELAIQI